MLFKIRTFLTKHNVVCNQEHGFRTNRTTSHALIITVIKNEEFALAHAIQKQTKKAHGIRGLAMHRYLENKYQYVQINSTIIITEGQIRGSAQCWDDYCLFYV